MPPNRNINYQILLINKSTPIVKKAYAFLRKQFAVVKEYIDKMLGKNFFCLSNLLYIIPILIVKKPEKSFQIYNNYYALNTLTIKNRNNLSSNLENFCALFSSQNLLQV